MTAHLSDSRLTVKNGSTRAGGIGTRIEFVTFGLDVDCRYSVNSTSYRGRQFSFEPRSGDHEYCSAVTMDRAVVTAINFAVPFR